MIGLVDYGAGNLGNVRRALEHLKLEHRLVHRGADLPVDGPILLPGVGNYGAAMRALRSSGLAGAVQSAVRDGRQLVGICLGLQLLFASSEEAPDQAGLGILDGSVKRVDSKGRPLPHLGWSPVEPPGTSFYFAHSFCVVPTEPGAVVATANWGERFPAIVRAGSIVGFQFHPERSGDAGLALLSGVLCRGAIEL